MANEDKRILVPQGECNLRHEYLEKEIKRFGDAQESMGGDLDTLNDTMLEIKTLLSSHPQEEDVPPDKPPEPVGMELLRRYWVIIVFVLGLLGYGTTTAVSGPSEEEVRSIAAEVLESVLHKVLENGKKTQPGRVRGEPKAAIVEGD